MSPIDLIPSKVLISSASESHKDLVGEYLVDKLTLRLAQVTEQIARGNGETIAVRKYHHQAKSLMGLIPIARPAPVFIIYTSDLTPKLDSPLPFL